VVARKLYPLKAAVEVLTKFPKAKFNETIDMAFKLGVDPKQSDQMVRGTVPLPHGSGKTVRVLVFAKPGAAADAARAEDVARPRPQPRKCRRKASLPALAAEPPGPTVPAAAAPWASPIHRRAARFP